MDLHGYCMVGHEVFALMDRRMCSDESNPSNSRVHTGSLLQKRSKTWPSHRVFRVNSQVASQKYISSVGQRLTTVDLDIHLFAGFLIMIDEKAYPRLARPMSSLLETFFV